MENSENSGSYEIFENAPLRFGESYDLEILRSLRRIIRSVDLYSRKLRRDYDLTGPQLMCLLEVATHGPITSSVIGKSVHLSASTVVGIIDRLEAKGLIKRERDRHDRRLVHVTVTELGSETAAAAPSPLQDSLAKALRGLPEAEQAAISRSLELIVDLMEARQVDAAPILTTGPINQE